MFPLPGPRAPKEQVSLHFPAPRALAEAARRPGSASFLGPLDGGRVQPTQKGYSRDKSTQGPGTFRGVRR